jgi:hypothetical protein
MVETVPPVTRETTFAIEFGPVNVAASPLLRLKVWKLWKRFCPRMVPKLSGIWKWGPVKVAAGPTVPSVRIWA